MNHYLLLSLTYGISMTDAKTAIGNAYRVFTLNCNPETSLDSLLH